MVACSFRSAILVGFVAVVVFLVIDHGPARLPLYIDGTIDNRFERVKEAFAQNFVDGWERGGASLAVYERGKKVVDLWGGYADRSALRRWDKDTLQVVFSTTKGVAAVCFAMLVDRGYVHYDDLVSSFWPEFAQNGKENVTVQMALSHAAGVPYFDEHVTEEQARDADYISKMFEKQKPAWTPGTRSGYHIYTFGWLVDQFIRRIDPKKRSIGQFVREELHDAYNVDMHVGLKKEEAYRVARLIPPSVIDRLSEMVGDYRCLKYLDAIRKIVTDSMLARALHNLPWLESVHQMTVNNPDFWTIEQAAALGIGNARALAAVFSLVGERKLVGEKTIELLLQHHWNETDLIMDDLIAKGNGFLYFPIPNSHDKFSFGHTGHGCQQVQLDVHNGIAIAYTANGLKTGLSHLCRTWSRLERSIYDALADNSH